MSAQITYPLDIDDILNDAGVALYGVNDDLARRVDQSRIVFLKLMDAAECMRDELKLKSRELWPVRDFLRELDKLVPRQYEDADQDEDDEEDAA